VLKVELLLGFMIYGELNKWYYCVYRGFDDTAAHLFDISIETRLFRTILIAEVQVHCFHTAAIRLFKDHVLSLQLALGKYCHFAFIGGD